MNVKELVIGGAVGVVVAAIVGAFIGTFSAGMDAQEKQQIREVLQDEMKVLINGEEKTLAEAISSIHTTVTGMEASLDVLIED